MKYVLWIAAFIILLFALRAGELYTQLARYRNFWIQANAKPVQDQDLVYVAFGDSAAQGIGASKPQNGYVGLISKELAQKAQTNIHTINLSKSGAKIADVLNTQLPEYNRMNFSKKPVITMEIGANDIISFDKNKFETEMDQLMSQLPSQTVISDIPTFKGGRLSKYEPNVIEANKIMNKLASSRGYDLAPLNRNVSNNHGLRTFAIDFFHPSDYGYKTNWAPAFLEKIKLEQ